MEEWSNNACLGYVITALENIGKHLKMFTDKIEASHSVSFEDILSQLK